MKDKNYYFQQTPKDLAKHLFTFVKFSKGDSFLEPFRGEGAFYDIMPNPKDWCEIEQGKDFFDYNKPVNHIITNPPFKVKKKNSFISSFEKCLNLANKSINFLINHNMFLSLTPTRLEKYFKQGWKFHKLHIVSVKEWFGRYYFVQFVKNGVNNITWNTKNWSKKNE